VQTHLKRLKPKGFLRFGLAKKRLDAVRDGLGHGGFYTKPAPHRVWCGAHLR